MPFVLRGWLFDVYPSAHGVTLWFIDRSGGKHRGFAPFRPSFFLHLKNGEVQRAEFLATRCPYPVSITKTTRMEIYSGDSLDVLQVHVHDATRLREVVWYYEKFFPHFALFNSDIPAQQLFLYETQLFPLALGD